MPIFAKTSFLPEEKTEEIGRFLTVNINFPIEKLLIYIREVEDQIVVPYIGSATYTRALTKYNDGSGTDLEKQLIEKIQAVTANLALAKFTPLNEVQFDKNGVSTINKSDTRTAAYDYQVTRVINTLLQSGNNAIEQLLFFLEENLVTFTEYAASSQHTFNTQGLITSAIEFDQYYYINRSRLTFNSLKNTMLAVENDRLQPIVGDDLYDEIKGTPTDAIKKRLARAARQAVVYQGIADALDLNLSFEISENGLRVHAASQYSNSKYFNAPTEQAIARVKQACQAKADVAWSKVAEILKEINPPAVAETNTVAIVSTPKFVAI